MVNYKAMVKQCTCPVCNRPFFRRIKKRRSKGFRSSIVGRARRYDCKTCSPKCSRDYVYLLAMYGKNFRSRLLEVGK